MDETRIFMVDDHNLFREGLSRLLESAPGFRVVGQCRTAAEAISALSKTPADVVLLDYDLGEERGSSLVKELRKCQHQVKVLMVTAGMSDAATLQTMEVGWTAKLSNLWFPQGALILSKSSSSGLSLPAKAR